jgi:transcriptional regulator with XRE-family HTH domain
VKKLNPNVTYLEVKRKQKNWTQEQLGAAARIAQYFISDLERGKGTPTPDQLQRLATALDLPVEVLLQPVPIPQVQEAVR